MPVCAVKLCRNYKGKLTLGTKVTFHLFPSHPLRAKRWINAVRKSRHDKTWTPTKSAVVCSDHFLPQDQYVTQGGRRKLRKDAVPVKALFLSSVESEESNDSEAEWEVPTEFITTGNIQATPSSASAVETDSKDCVEDANTDAKNKIASIDELVPITHIKHEPDVGKTESEKKIGNNDELVPFPHIKREPDVEEIGNEKKIASIGELVLITHIKREPDVEETENEKKIASIDELVPIIYIKREPEIEETENEKQIASIDKLVPIIHIKREPDVENTDYSDTDQNQPSVDVQIKTKIGGIQSEDEVFSDLDSIFDSPREALIRKELRRKIQLQVQHKRLIKSLRRKNARLQKRNDAYTLLINNLSKYIEELQKK